MGTALTLRGGRRIISPRWPNHPRPPGAVQPLVEILTMVSKKQVMGLGIRARNRATIRRGGERGRAAVSTCSQTGIPARGLDLKTEWEMIRKEFFPRWDRARQWKCRRVADADGCHGRCLWDRKIIELAYFTEKTLLTLLVHEMCHAVTRGGHGAEWLARMTMAAKRADDIGMKSLAGEIRSEVRDYKGSPKITAADIYNRMEDVVCDCEDISFGDAVKGIGREFGMSRREFLSEYPRLRTIYDKATAEKRQWAERREKIRQARKENHT